MNCITILIDFNSIKVRLEHSTRHSPESLQIFQFHKGTIRTKFLIMLHIQNNYFNSIKVRLEQGAGNRQLPRQQFQFHKGAIRT